MIRLMSNCAVLTPDPLASIQCPCEKLGYLGKNMYVIVTKKIPAIGDS